MVKFENLDRVAKLLQNNGAADVTLKTYPGIHHTSCAQEEEDVRAFLNRVVPP